MAGTTPYLYDGLDRVRYDSETALYWPANQSRQR